MFPKQMKRAKANQKLVICRMSQRHRGSSVLSPSSCSPPRLQGLFPPPACLFIIHAACARDRESRGFNRGGGTSRKPIIHGIQSLHFLRWSFEWFWYSMMNYHNQMRRGETRRRGGGGVAKAGDWKRKIQEEFFAFAPSGRRVCWWSTVRFSGKRIFTHPPTHASLSNRMKSQRRSSFIHRSSCAARLLLIKQWRPPFDRSWRKFHLGDTDNGCQVQPGGKVGFALYITPLCLALCKFQQGVVVLCFPASLVWYQGSERTITHMPAPARLVFWKWKDNQNNQSEMKPPSMSSAILSPPHGAHLHAHTPFRADHSR